MRSPRSTYFEQEMASLNIPSSRTGCNNSQLSWLELDAASRKPRRELKVGRFCLVNSRGQVGNPNRRLPYAKRRMQHHRREQSVNIHESNGTTPARYKCASLAAGVQRETPSRQRSWLIAKALQASGDFGPVLFEWKNAKLTSRTPSFTASRTSLYHFALLSMRIFVCFRFRIPFGSVRRLHARRGNG